MRTNLLETAESKEVFLIVHEVQHYSTRQLCVRPVVISSGGQKTLSTVGATIQTSLRKGIATVLGERFNTPFTICVSTNSRMHRRLRDCQDSS